MITTIAAVNPADTVIMSKTKMRAPKATMVTAPLLSLPTSSHPIWTLGFTHVTIAIAICDAFATLGANNVK